MIGLILFFSLIIIIVITIAIIRLVELKLLFKKNSSNLFCIENFIEIYRKIVMQKYALQENLSYNFNLVDWQKQLGQSLLTIDEVEIAINKLKQNNKKYLKYIDLKIIEKEAIKNFNNDKKFNFIILKKI